ncbi:nucleoside triphosphate pyrophosphohydrolase [Metabacillus sp. GX 13764]|uniref:nucleoside triphosphate pyrophosphohydrolase n=1 Tax=Metabacillus kandeliae TaxID=2900151 RepID=UPI001E6164D9|nr:nucleoside triphosphate pyrophosphohydrolase [Metabacillus kandeliae]MCD7036652.1 nucleoside triphosphate pyrophosphohydrolase [Metabacillus kandeliae]
MKKITIVGLGSSSAAQLPLGVYRMLISAGEGALFVRTADHPVLKELHEELPPYVSFDSIYEKHDQFDPVYEEITAVLLEKAKSSEVIYAVPGHPLVAEKTVQLLIAAAEREEAVIEIAGGQSFLDAMFAALKIDPVDGFQLLDASSMKRDDLKLTQHLIICQVYDQMSASMAKLTLMEEYPDEYEVAVIQEAGGANEKIKWIPLYELDRGAEVNNLTSLYIPPIADERLVHHQFSAFRNVVKALRAPGGCPWDREQTHASLKKYLIEECYELLEAIDEEDPDHMVEELGDVLLQVVLHSQIGEDEGMFTADDVIRTVTEKMIRRHPHVFGGAAAENTEQVLANWDEIKKQEGKYKEESRLGSVAGSLPALSKAYQLQKKAAKAGFDWPDASGAWDKLKEELQEFEAELSRQKVDSSLMLREFGDILFAFVNIARFYKIEPEEALASTNHKFTSRFQYIENQARLLQKELEDMTLEEMDRLWDEAKTKE